MEAILDSNLNMKKNSVVLVNMHRNSFLRKNSDVDSLRRASKGT